MYCQTNVLLIFSIITLIASASKFKRNNFKNHDLQNFIFRTRRMRNFENSTINQDNKTRFLHKNHNIATLLERNEESPIEGLLCNLNGSWVSEAGGCRLDINYQTNTRHKFPISIADRIPPSSEGFLNPNEWTVFGEVPFERSGLVVVLAVRPADKHLATFIGECRTCDGYESVTGTWLIGRTSRDCKDQKVAHQILGDVWRREVVHTLLQKHSKEINGSTTTGMD